MRRIPRALKNGVLATTPVNVADHGATKAAACPVVAGQIEVPGPSTPLRGRACQHVVPVGSHAEPCHFLTPLGQRVLLIELVVVAVKIVGIFCDDLPLEVLPRASSDAV